MDKMKKFKETYLDKNKPLKILDVGSFDVNGSYADIFREPKWIYHGTDISQGKNVDIVLESPYIWNKIESSSYDIVISGQAFEHVEYFWITMLQINRVLKKDGLACIIAPADGYEHRYPLDCWRFYPDGLQSLSRWSKMDVVEAWTQWESQNYSDESDVWKDSVLVCKKTIETPNIINLIKRLTEWATSNEVSGTHVSQEYETKILELQRTINEIHNSFTWKTLRKYDKFKAKLLRKVL
jgi:SAM-dependent methyltransferase